MVIHKLKMDLLGSETTKCIDVTQGDSGRILELSLYAGSLPWSVPEGTTVLIRYRTSNKKWGEYDTLPDGTTAWDIDGNALKLVLAPQATAVPGPTLLSAVLLKEGNILNTFRIEVRVQENIRSEMGSRTDPSENYSCVTGFVPAPDRGRVGQYLQISAVDERGKVTGMQAVNLAAGEGTGSAGGYYTPAVSQLDGSTVELSFTPSEEGMDEIPVQRITLPAGPQGPMGPQGPAGTGSGGNALIDVIALPEGGINENALYRLMKGSITMKQYVQPTYAVHIVAELPAVGLPATNLTQTEANFYYNNTDESVSGYVDANLSAAMGVPSGWYSAATLLGALGLNFGGVITNILDDPDDGSVCLLLEYELYSYKEGWSAVKTPGWYGTGSNAEIFNHPSNIASGQASHAEGVRTEAFGDYSHAEGVNTESRGTYSHAEGSSTTASGDSSHAEGMINTASGEASHTEGSSTRASGDYSHAEGYSTEATGEASHAEGGYTDADGDYSHAEGYEAEANGLYSHAEGYGTQAAGACQHVEGKLNILDSNNRYAHIVGNGTPNTRSNAHTLDWNGNAWFAGGLKVGGTGQDDSAAKTVLLANDTASETMINALIDAKLGVIENGTY